MARPDQRVGITQASQELPEELSEIESSIEEDADRSYPEDFADDTGTGTLDRSEPRQSAAASPRSLTSDKEASYSEDFAEATLEATMEEALPTPDIPRATLDRRQEIALRQQADSKKVIVPLVPEDDDIEEEDIPEGGDFSEDDLEGSSSMYDPEVRRREMEKEEQQREEEERLRREQEQAEQARKQKEIDEANRRLAAERQRKLEEERKREEEEAFRRKQQEELQREQARRAEEQRKQAEEAERKREEERRKAEEQETRRREEERRKAEEETRRREEEQRKKSEEENMRREEERRKAEEETRKREEERKKAEEETKRQEEEERRKAEEEAKKREKEEAERRKAEEELLQKREEAMRAIPSQVRQQAVASEEPGEPQKQRQMMEAQARELQEPDRPKQPDDVEGLVPEVLRSTPESPAKDSNFASPLVAGAGLRPRRFSGTWIQTELDTAGHLEDGEIPPQAAPGPDKSRSYQMEPSRQTELRSRPCSDNVWSSPKSQWDEQRTASTTAGDRSYRTGWSSRWEQAGAAGEWPDRDDWRGSWWDRDWHLQRDEEDFRPFEVRSQGRERWGSLGEDLPTWSQRRSRDLWPDTPGHWEKESWPRQDKENCVSQLGEWDWERARRSPSRASGLWQSRPKAAWEAAAASFPNHTAALPQPLGIAPGFYGQPTPFGVLYPWGFGSYPLPGTGPGPCLVAPPTMAESATLSPTGASPARPAPEEQQDEEDEEAPAPPAANILETTLPVGPSDLDFQESLVSAFAAVVDEMLQFKYGCGIDTADYRGKLRALCDASALCSMARLLDAANSQKEFVALDSSNCQVQLRLTYQELSSFGGLCERLRILPGTASAVVVISTRGGYAVQALAAFRPSCDFRHAVGRCGLGTNARALEHFAEEEFCSAVALEPTILSLQAPLGGPLREPPALTEEFRSLRQLLLGRPGAGASQRSSGALAPQLLAALHARAPSALAFRHVASALAGNDVQPDVVDELFRRLVDWFRSSSPSVVAAAQGALAEAPAHVALVARLRKAPERRRLCELGCQLLARAARHHVENAAAFVGAGAAQLVCEMLDRHYGVKELQRCGLQALAILAHYGGGASQALAADALRLSLRALRAHRASASVQIAGCEVLRCLAELAEAPLEELSEAAQLAKRAFPEDSAVHRAADALLSFAIPRSAAAIGSLMDSATADETAQRNAICSLGHLAGYGGVAWRGASRVALNRILRAMAQHKGSAVLVASGLWALGRFAERVDAPQGGLQDAAQQAKESHPNSALVGRHADELIAYLMRPQ